MVVIRPLYLSWRSVENWKQIYQVIRSSDRDKDSRYSSLYWIPAIQLQTIHFGASTTQLLEIEFWQAISLYSWTGIWWISPVLNVVRLVVWLRAAVLCYVYRAYKQQNITQSVFMLSCQFLWDSWRRSQLCVCPRSFRFHLFSRLLQFLKCKWNFMYVFLLMKIVKPFFFFWE